MVVLKPLYKIAKAGTYWWAIYSKHYKEKLLITTFIFNLCFLITTTGTPFGIISMQTDDIIILRDNQFSAFKEDELIKANLIAKLKKKLNLTTPLLFNGCILSLNKDSIDLCQKG
jgi:predicted nucleic acid-binding protein